MKQSKVKRICAVALAATLGLSVLTGCGASKENKAGGSKQEMTYNLGTDPKTLDPALNNAIDGSIVLVNAFEGLYKLDKNDKAVPGIAEKCDISEDGKVYTFHLKKDAKWSNGDTIKASDFEFAWKRVMNPETAAEYAYQMSYIKGADEYNKGKGSIDAVGVKATDDNTLQVTLTEACPYFLELTAFPCYFPVNKAVVEKDKDWATKAESYVSNGPFKITDYKMKDQIVLEKNPNYEAKDSVKLDKLTVKLVGEETSAWASYKSGQFDAVYTVPLSEVQGAVKDGSAKIFKQLGTYFYCVNVSDKAKEVNPDAAKVLSDVRVRKALNLAIDRPSIIKNVTKAEQIPAHSYVPEGIKTKDGKDFADKQYFKPEGDVAEAKKLLAEAGYPDGQGFPSIVLTFNPESGHGTIAQATQDMLKKNLGINVELQSQEWKVFQTTRDNKKYEIARHGWVADYVDPMTFLEMWISTSGQNNAGYNNPEYDKLIAASKLEKDETKRFELMRKAEDLLMEDMPILPMYYYTQAQGIKDYVKDIRISPLGFVYFDKVYIEGK